MFVLSSKFEDLAYVLIKALSCGCPCVRTNCPSGPAEILDNGQFGPLVPVRDESELKVAMEHVLDSSPNKGTLFARAEEFSFDTSIDHYERIIVELVHRRRRR